jgi:hypothetical protein
MTTTHIESWMSFARSRWWQGSDDSAAKIIFKKATQKPGIS